jgi:hypothetical protein
MPQYKLHIIIVMDETTKFTSHVSCVTIFCMKKTISYVVMVLELTMFSMLEVTTTSYLNFKLDLQSITPLNNA